jgi:hypothetical protein
MDSFFFFNTVSLHTRVGPTMVCQLRGGQVFSFVRFNNKLPGTVYENDKWWDQLKLNTRMNRNPLGTFAIKNYKHKMRLLPPPIVPDSTVEIRWRIFVQLHIW